MPKQPIAVELEAINREGETQVVRDSGLTVQGLRASPGHLGGRLRHGGPRL